MRCPVLACDFEGSLSNIHIHLRSIHPQIGGNAAECLDIQPFTEIRAFRGYLRSYRHRYGGLLPVIRDVNTYFANMEETVKKIIGINAADNRALKLQFSLLCEFERGEPGSPDYEKCEHFLNSKSNRLFTLLDFPALYATVKSQISHVIEIFEEFGSSWTLKRILGLDIRVAKYTPLRRGRCFIEIPVHLKSKRALVNVRNSDKCCFKWAFLSIMHYEDVVQCSSRNRVTQYARFAKMYDFECMNFPPDNTDISKFEKRNIFKKIAINIFEYNPEDNNCQIALYRISPNAMNPEFSCVDLLLIHDYANGQSHYVGITSIGRLFGKRGYRKKFFCYNCQNFYGKNKYQGHIIDCKRFKCQKTYCPPKQFGKAPVIRFEDYQKTIPHEYIMYLDLEAMMQPEDQMRGKQTKLLSKHIPSGFCLILVSRAKGIVDSKTYRGKYVAKKLFQTIERFSNFVKNKYRDNTKMLPLTEKQKKMHLTAIICYLCKRKFTQSNYKVKDHDHQTGKYRGSCHLNCNALYTLKKCKIPIFSHNFRSYDLHLIFSGFEYYEGKLAVIPNNSEKYISIICKDFVFLDSMMFLNASLETLVARLKENNDFTQNFRLLVQYFGKQKAEELSRKGVYPYDFVKSHEMFSLTTFPSHDSFYNILSEENVSLDDYAYAQAIYNKYCSNLGEYHDLYLTCDTILLACVMENFRDLCITNYELDAAHFFTLSGFTWNAALKFTGVELEQITDIEQYNFFEIGMRGGTAMICKREAHANNKYMIDYNPKLESSYIIPWDCVNLYGFSLSDFLPYSDFQWLSTSEVANLNSQTIMSWKDDGVYGYVLQCDILYRESLHRRDNDYPLAAERMVVTESMLSDFQLFLNPDFKGNTEKLVPHLGKRKRYVVHYRNLKYYIEKGLIVEKIWRVLRFRQSRWLKPYIDFNTDLRKKAKDKFSKDLFKFMVNATFGKSCENVRRRRKIEIISTQNECEKNTRKPNFKSFNILNTNLAIIELENTRVCLSKPIYCGFTCLELSKLHMHRFHLDVIKKRYGDDAELLLTDTDSLQYHIYTKDIYKDMKEMEKEFDFSDYPHNHFLFSETNKKVMGKFKDESNAKIIKSFYGLAPKMYSFEGEGIWKKAAKGIKKAIIERHCKHKDYAKVFKSQISKRIKMNLIRSYRHQLYTVQLKKKGLQPFDSKRYMLNDGVYTLAHNHVLIKYL